jgi:hypothetical protein
MNDNEQVKNEYHKEAIKLLSAFPDALKAFEKEWLSENFRQAFLIVHKATRQLDAKRSPEQEKLFERFYWLFVN